MVDTTRPKAKEDAPCVLPFPRGDAPGFAAERPAPLLTTEAEQALIAPSGAFGVLNRRLRQCPARALAIRVGILREEMQHCLERRAACYSLADAYLDEFDVLNVQARCLSRILRSAALKPQREAELRKLMRA